MSRSPDDWSEAEHALFEAEKEIGKLRDRLARAMALLREIRPELGKIRNWTPEYLAKIDALLGEDA